VRETAIPAEARGATEAAEAADAAGPTGDAGVWTAAEAGVIRRIRGDLLGRRGLDPRRVVTRGYWKAGAANHPDHDYGEDG
jgi:NADPH-dependent ferric siderophore reductase